MWLKHRCIDFQTFRHNTTLVVQQTDNDHTDDTDGKDEAHTVQKWNLIDPGSRIWHRKPCRCQEGKIGPVRQLFEDDRQDKSADRCKESCIGGCFLPEEAQDKHRKYTR